MSHSTIQNIDAARDGIAPASSCGMKVGRSPRDRRNGRDKVRSSHNCANLTGGGNF